MTTESVKQFLRQISQMTETQAIAAVCERDHQLRIESWSLLASALRKFAPDEVQAVVDRWQNNVDALDEFLAVLRGGP